MLKTFILGWILLVTNGLCRAQTGSSYPLTYKNRQIVVGQGGGITGASTVYYWLENGSLSVKSDHDSLYTRLGRKPAALTRRFFNELEKTCRIKTTRFNQPGNRYQFVCWKKNQQEFTVSWGDPRQPPPARFVTFYRSFIAQIPKPRR